MGAAAWQAGHLVVAVQLNISFRTMLPLGTDTYLEAWVEGVDGRKVRTHGRLHTADGATFAEAEGLFLEIDAERFRPMLEKAAADRGVSVEELLARLPGKALTPGPSPAKRERGEPCPSEKTSRHVVGLINLHPSPAARERGRG